MILPFKKIDKNKNPTNFKDKILSGVKIHSIREDAGNRRRIGQKIHCAYGARTKKYDCFLETTVVGIQKFEIKWIGEVNLPWRSWFIFVDEKKLDAWGCYELYKNDGFETMGGFLAWFNKSFTGKIIHWTDFKY